MNIAHPRTRALARLVFVAALLALAALPGRAQAQELYTFTVAGLGGVGGSIDADPGDDLGNPSLQVNFAIITEPKTHLVFRLGRVDLDIDEGFGILDNAELTYLTAAGEYRYYQSFYQSGIYLGLGAYRLEGTDFFTLRDEEETAIGAVLGLTGEFEINRHLGVLVEVSGHWADLDQAQVFAMGHVGLAFHF